MVVVKKSSFRINIDDAYEIDELMTLESRTV